MGCSTCGGAVIYSGGRGSYSAPEPRIPNPNCSITKELLTVWKNILTCIKVEDRASQIGLGIPNINQLLGIIQSALNYPDDYCFYEEALTNFQSIILPKIMLNVPECLNEL